ncbi:roadblock/LC7 domain-containing protein [Streptomyces sp. NPDC059070]|uniref:roadblock/LC7 domain-containing protein n=1 Tax=unclassified Streptomyces TaxID=2593676 RepID=UPI0034E1D0C8
MIRVLRQRAGRRQLVAAETEILAELRRLRVRLPQVTGALAAGYDGRVLAQDAGAGADAVAVLTASAVGAARRFAEHSGLGGLHELLLRGEEGYAATYAAGTGALLTLLAQPRVNVGRLHLEGRRASARIGELVDGALDRPENP